MVLEDQMIMPRASAYIGAGANGYPPVAAGSGLIMKGSMVMMRALAACLVHDRPEMHVGDAGVGTPVNDASV